MLMTVFCFCVSIESDRHQEASIAKSIEVARSGCENLYNAVELIPVQCSETYTWMNRGGCTSLQYIPGPSQWDIKNLAWIAKYLAKYLSYPFS